MNEEINILKVKEAVDGIRSFKIVKAMIKIGATLLLILKLLKK